MRSRAFLLLATICVASNGFAQSTALHTGVHEFHVNGVRLWYRVAGRALPNVPPVVFLHGGPGQGSVTFAEMAGPYLEPKLRMVYFDQRGSGLSERPASGDYALATLVDDIEALRRHLAVPRIALIAHSFGGVLALEYGAKYPERVSHIVFVAGLYDTKAQCRYRRERFAASRPEAYQRFMADTANQRVGDCDVEFRALRGAEREAYNNEAMFPDSLVRVRMDSVQKASGQRNTGELGAALFKAGLVSYRFTALRKVTAPVLVVAGKHDYAAGGPPLRALARALPKGRYIEYEKSGHFVYLDEPERFARDVTRFIHRGR